MDAVTIATAANPQISGDSYQWMGRQRAEFWAGQAKQAQATGTDKTEIGFKDVLDLVNPLQHLPIIGSIYRAVTGDDDMKPAVKTAGDIAYGGPLAGVSSVMDDIFKQASGSDMISTLASWVGIGDSAPDAQIAAADKNANVTVVAAAASQTNTAAMIIDNNPAAAAQTQPATKPIVLASAAPLPNATPNVLAEASPDAALTATSAPTNSQLFKNLQRGAAPQGQVLGATQQKFFNPTAKQFAGVTPASFHPSKDIANSNASIAVQAAIQTDDITRSAAQSSNAVIANANATASAHADSAQAPQSEFAQKMMAALDRYEAAKKAGDPSAPAVSTGL